MTERDRLAAEVNRLEWLADAALGPRQLPRRPEPPAVLSGTRYAVPLDLCRRGFATALGLGRRVGTIRPGSVWLLPQEATEQEMP
jgi:hypothetical protein